MIRVELCIVEADGEIRMTANMMEPFCEGQGSTNAERKVGYIMLNGMHEVALESEPLRKYVREVVEDREVGQTEKEKEKEDIHD